MALLKIYTDENAAREHLESLNWPDGPVCPHCGSVERGYQARRQVHPARRLQVHACQKPFSVTVGTVFERSKIPLQHVGSCR